MSQPTQSIIPSEPANNTDLPAHTPKRANSLGLIQAYQFREIAANQAMELAECPAESLGDKLARAKALQSLGAVWSDACDRIRIMRGKPLPGSLRPQSKPTKRKQISSAPSEEPSGSMPTDHTK